MVYQIFYDDHQTGIKYSNYNCNYSTQTLSEFIFRKFCARIANMNVLAGWSWIGQ